MNIRFWVFLLCCTVSAVVADAPVLSKGGTAVPEPGAAVGMVVSLKGEASVLRHDGSKEVLKVRSPICVGDRIETGMKATVQVNFIDRSKVQLAGSTDFTVEVYAFEDKKSGQFEGRIDNGALSFMAGKVGQIAPEKFKVRTAMATVGIRGSSGEIQASDGTLPGVAPSFQVVKRAGVGLTAELSGAPELPPMDIAENGRGLVLESPGQVREVAFSGSIVASYSASVEGNVAAGREEQKRSEVLAVAEKGEGEPMLAEPSGPAPDQQPPPEGVLANDMGKKEGGPDQPALAGTEGPGEDAPTQEPPEAMAAAQEPMMQGDAPPVQPSEPMLAAQPEPGPAAPPPPPPVDNQIAVMPGNFVAADAAPPVPMLPPIQSQVMAQTQTLTASTKTVIEEKTTVQRDSALVTQAVQQQVAQESYTGTFVGLINPSTVATLVDTSVAVVVDPNGKPAAEALALTIPSNSLTYTMPIITKPSSGVAETQIIDSTVRHARQADSTGALTLISSLSDSGTPPIMGTTYYGKKATTVPSSGQSHYESWFPEEADSRIIGCLALKGGKVEYPVFTSDGVADWSEGKFALSFLHDLDPLGPESLRGQMAAPSPCMIIAGMDTNGTMSTPTAYYAYGFAPSHAEPPSTLKASDATFGFQIRDYSGYTGSGQIFGNAAEGVVVLMDDASDGALLATSRLDSQYGTWLTDDGTYEGWGIGFKVTGVSHNTVAVSKLDALTVTPAFTGKTLSFASTVDAVSGVAAGSSLVIVDREHLFGSIAGTGSVSLDEDKSFFNTLPLPTVRSSQNSSADLPIGAMWGQWNAAGLSGSNVYYPGQHNYWVAGIPTVTNPGGANTKAKLGAPANHLYFRGQVLRSTVDRSADYLGDADLGFVQGWRMDSFADTDGALQNSPFEPGDLSGLIVASDSGYVDMMVDLANHKVRGIAWLSNQSVLVFKAESEGAVYPSISGTLTALSLYRDNNTSAGLYTSSFPGAPTGWSGKYCGAGVPTLIWNFKRRVTSDADIDLVGVGMAKQVAASDTIDSENISAFLQGVMFDAVDHSTAPNGLPTLLTTPDLKLELAGLADTQALTFTLDIDGGTEVLRHETNSINTYLSKDAFISMMEIQTAVGPGNTVTWASNVSSRTVDEETSLICTVPGLQGFGDVTWGRWLSSEEVNDEDDPREVLMGYFGGGRTHLDGVLQQIPDAAVLAASSNPVVTYAGPAIGSYMTA
ncbi:MAG: FecR domain-containing protein, partial [Chlamydiia bacterium]|nr:FecR domain-containing protein [Chlamydiia bacterium]